MAAAFLVIPFVDGHVAVRAFAVLRQLPVPQRVALLAAGNEVPGVDEAGGLVAEPAPGRFTAGVDLAIRAIALKVAFVAAAVALKVFHSSHLNSGFRIFRLYYS
jgi:hypothetical protein